MSKKYFTKTHLANAVSKFNDRHLGTTYMKWEYQRGHGYNIFICKRSELGRDGAFEDVYDGLSLRSAVKLAQAADTVCSDTRKIYSANSMRMQDQLAKAQDSLRTEKNKVRVLSDRLEHLKGKCVPYPADICRVLKSATMENVALSLEWAAELALASLNHRAQRHINIHPFDGPMFAELYQKEAAHQEPGKALPFFGYTYEEARRIQAVLEDRYWEDIQVALLLGPYR